MDVGQQLRLAVVLVPPVACFNIRSLSKGGRNTQRVKDIKVGALCVTVGIVDEGDEDGRVGGGARRGRSECERVCFAREIEVRLENTSCECTHTERMISDENRVGHLCFKKEMDASPPECKGKDKPATAIAWGRTKALTPRPPSYIPPVRKI